MVGRLIRKRQPSLKKAKTRYCKKMQGDLTNLQMLRLVNSFVVLRRCPDAERLVLVNRPTHRGRRNSIAVGNQVNENVPVIDVDVDPDIDPEQVPEPEPQPQPQPQQIRTRSFSVYGVPRDQTPLHHNLDEYRTKVDDKVSTIDEEDENQIHDVQEDTAQVDESQVEETQMEESHIAEGQSEVIQIQDIESPQLTTSDEEITTNDCGSDSDIATPEFNNSTQLHYLEDESFVSNAPVDDTNQSVESVESLLFAKHHVIANDIDEPNDTSTTSDDAETSIGIDENVNVVGNLEDSGFGNSVTESNPLKTSTNDTGISSDVDDLTTDVTDSSELEVTEADLTVDLTMEDSENSVSDEDDTVPLDLSRKNLLKRSDSIDLTVSPNKAVPMETDRAEATQNDYSIDDSRQGQAEPIEDQQPADEKSVCDSTDSEETTFNVSSDSSNLEVSSSNLMPNLENDVSTAATNEIDQTAEKMALTDDETSEEDENGSLNLSHTVVSQQETQFEPTMQMDIDRADNTQYKENTLNGHEDMLQDEVVDHPNGAVPINDSQSDQGTALNLSHKLAVANVLTSDNNRNVGSVEKPMLQFKKEIEVVVDENSDAEHKENVAH